MGIYGNMTWFTTFTTGKVIRVIRAELRRQCTLVNGVVTVLAVV
jgi:hypothetical protein